MSVNRAFGSKTTQTENSVDTSEDLLSEAAWNHTCKINEHCGFLIFKNAVIKICINLWLANFVHIMASVNHHDIIYCFYSTK